MSRLPGAFVLIFGMALLGKGGMIKFGCSLIFDGLAMLLGIILVAVANGWLVKQIMGRM